jgi:BirA family biotin operon repressor/biotin-[acetyl-CoA-carboxylase] ligase
MSLGIRIIYREKVSSTNDLAFELLKERRVSEGTVVYAGEQDKGRGQRGNTWLSEPGKNLTMSIILKPHFLPADKQFYISRIISLAIIDLLSELVRNISIKWPNDIYVGSDKIAGILIEHSITGDKLTSSIAGIGLNLNQVKFPDTLPNPVSLGLITGEYHDVNKVLGDLCSLISRRYEQIAKGELKVIDKDYHSHLYLRNRPSEFMTAKGVIRGSIRKVNKYGQLVVDTELSGPETFSFKEIEFIPPVSSSH